MQIQYVTGTVYIGDLIRKSKTITDAQRSNIILYKILFADDQVVIEVIENKYHLSTEFHFQHDNIIVGNQNYGIFWLLSHKNKIVVNNTALEHVSHFQYLGHDISQGKDKDINNETNNRGNVVESLRKTH